MTKKGKKGSKFLFAYGFLASGNSVQNHAIILAEITFARKYSKTKDTQAKWQNHIINIRYAFSLPLDRWTWDEILPHIPPKSHLRRYSSRKTKSHKYPARFVAPARQAGWCEILTDISPKPQKTKGTQASISGTLRRSQLAGGMGANPTIILAKITLARKYQKTKDTQAK